MPTTPDSIAARNRSNARHSTGPRTSEGKAIASQNARKHSFTVLSHTVLANEDPEVYAAFEREVVEAYNPQSDRERLASLEIANCRWALRRFDEAEAALWNTCFARDNQSAGETLADQCIRGVGDPPSVALHSMDLLTRYRRPWDRRLQNAVREFDRARLDRNREERLALAKERGARLASNKEREARQQAQQGQRNTPRSGKPSQEGPGAPFVEIPCVEMPLGAHQAEAPPQSGFVSSPAIPAPSWGHQSAAA